MLQHTFKCEVLTPLFLGGADARGVPELRSPSIRGAMRYWYRALLGGTNPSLKSLHEAESLLFGKAEHGGKLVTRLRYKGELKIQTYRKSRPHRTPQGDFLPKGKDYLFWSMASSGKPNTTRFRPARQYIEPGVEFEVVLGAKLEEDALRHGEAAFWLLANLGAVGARANRGAGAFQVLENETHLPFGQSASIPELRDHLRDGIRACLHVAGGAWGTFPPDTLPPYDVLHPQFCKIWIVAESSEGWDSYENALDGLGRYYRDYRTHLNPLGRSDHDAVLDWYEHRRTPSALKRPIFGLPVAFRYSQGGPADVLVPEKGDRRGSPLHMRITRLTKGRYAGVLTLFASQFLPQDTKLKLQRRKWTAPPPDDYTIIENFVHTFPLVREVVL